MSCSDLRDHIYFKRSSTLMEKYKWAQNVDWSTVATGDGTNMSSPPHQNHCGTAANILDLVDHSCDATTEDKRTQKSRKKNLLPRCHLEDRRLLCAARAREVMRILTYKHGTLQLFRGPFPTDFHPFVQPQPRPNQPLTSVSTAEFNVNVMGIKKNVGPTALTSLWEGLTH